MQEELRTIKKNNTWELVENSIKKPIDVKWVYKLKLMLDGKISKNKDILVAKGFLQKPNIDFEEVYTPIVML